MLRAVPIRPLDISSLKARFESADPFPHVVIENFLDPDFALQVAASYPNFEDSVRVGREFRTVNESRKVQVCDYQKFSSAVKRLADAIAGPEFLRSITQITGVKNLLWDDTLSGGGMHQTASSGLLDVHVDFNRLPERQLYRRLNLLLYLNPVWEASWGGNIELWDREVKVCRQSWEPIFNRCLIFETSEHSFHGVTAVRCPPHIQRKSFAVYYYTREMPEGVGLDHSTIFKARPNEHLKRYALMPAEKAKKELEKGVKAAKDVVRKFMK